MPTRDFKTKDFLEKVDNLIERGLLKNDAELIKALNWNKSVMSGVRNNLAPVPQHIYTKFLLDFSDKFDRKREDRADDLIKDKYIALLEGQLSVANSHLKASLEKIEVLLEHLQKVGNVNQAYLKAHVDGFLAHRKTMEKKDYRAEFDKVVADNLTQILETGK